MAFPCVVVGFVVLILLTVWNDRPFPSVKGVTLEQYLSTATEELNQVWGEDFTEEIESFGPRAIPYLIEQYDRRESGFQRAWRGLLQKLGRPQREFQRALLRTRALEALCILGRLDPEPVDRFLFALTKTNHFTMYWLGKAGPRHFAYLTNQLTGAEWNSEAAMTGLKELGTNARPAIPVLLSIYEGKAKGGRPIAALTAVRDIGGDPVFGILTNMLLGADSRDQRAAVSVLAGWRGREDQVAGLFTNLVAAPGFDAAHPGPLVTSHLFDLGVPLETVVDVFKRRLREAAQAQDSAAMIQRVEFQFEEFRRQVQMRDLFHGPLEIK